MTAFNRRLTALLRWARANDWRPIESHRRRARVYVWTNQVADPGNRHAPTMWVTLRAAGTFGSVRVEQILMPYGRVTIGEFTISSGQGALDVLAGMGVIPREYSTAHLDTARQVRLADRARDRAVLRANALADDLGDARREAEQLRQSAEEEAEDRWHRAVLRRHMAEHGLEDPTWRNLSEREKQVLRAADEQVLAGSQRRLPTGRDAA